MKGTCGSCWSFAAIVPIEFNTCKKSGTAIALRYSLLFFLFFIAISSL